MQYILWRHRSNILGLLWWKCGWKVGQLLGEDDGGLYPMSLCYFLIKQQVDKFCWDDPSFSINWGNVLSLLKCSNAFELYKARTGLIQLQGHVSVKEIPAVKGSINIVQTLYLHLRKPQSGLKTQFRVIFIKIPSLPYYFNISLPKSPLSLVQSLFLHNTEHWTLLHMYM